MSVELEFDLLLPGTVKEAVGLMQTHPDARYLAGGTDLVPNLRRGIGEPEIVIGLQAIEEMHTISETPEHIMIGAGVTLAQLLASDLPSRFPALCAAAEIASPALRQAATIGGNLCLDTRCLFYNQSKWWRKSNAFCLKLGGDTCHVAPKGSRCHATFSGDLAPALLVLGAEVSIVNSGGSHWMPLADLYTENGLDHLTLPQGDLLAAIRLPVGNGDQRSGYLKSRVRNAGDFPLAGVAVALQRQGDQISQLTVAVTGTNSRPLLFDGLAELIGQNLSEDSLNLIAKHIGQAIKPMRTTNLPGLYRRQMVTVLTSRLIRQLYEEGVNDG
jgi:4-hydroxybenzoyl-CoA reductase subunit beta